MPADTVSIKLEDGTNVDVPANPAGDTAATSFDWNQLTANSVSLIGAGANLVNSLAKLKEEPQQPKTQAQTAPQQSGGGVPWLWIGAGLVVVGLGVYLIVKK